MYVVPRSHIQGEPGSITAGANLIFRFDGAFIHECPEIRQAWQDHYDADSGGPATVCLVTGRETSVEAVHPAIKGVQGAQSSGAALVSFNAPAFCSYGKEQNLNAPISKYAAFAYTSAFNHLLGWMLIGSFRTLCAPTSLISGHSARS